MAGFRACGIAVMAWWACAVVTHGAPVTVWTDSRQSWRGRQSRWSPWRVLCRHSRWSPCRHSRWSPWRVLPPQPVESLAPERAERPVAPSSCSSEESTSEAEAERRRERRRREEEASRAEARRREEEALRAEARRREEAIEQEVETRVASRLAAAHQAGEALPDVLRILLELQTLHCKLRLEEWMTITGSSWAAS